MVANRMREKGYRRTIDQCKCKWKNLVSRYKVVFFTWWSWNLEFDVFVDETKFMKFELNVTGMRALAVLFSWECLRSGPKIYDWLGQDASDPDNGRQCPFFDELHALFTARENRMQHAQPDLETGSLKGRKRLKNISGDRSHEEYSQERDDEEETGIDQAETETVAPKRKAGAEKKRRTGQLEKQLNNNNGVLASIQEMLGSFIKQQQMIDMQWKESMEKCAQERELLEQEWREKMEKLEREKLVMEQAWREREEQRRLREESRAEKRDALLTTLLNKLIREEDS
ncbi:UNVERIFIED_CONTAM: Trihelix transcription factor GT-3b [Sesamum radiatum]|uniref:Trihelix transcription factor GT-3b n=1 Tax=Sesamum radiatum TaxID=300843 RepID=A0AAW2L0E2_SESRA